MVLPTVSKVLEKIVLKRIQKHLHDNSLIGDQQFITSVSTSDQLLDLYHKMVSALDDQKTNKLLFLDVARTFDKVWRRGLLYKIWKMDIRRELYIWLEDYLRNRSQRVRVGNSLSDWLPVKAGVPQGRQLGPDMFKINIEDLKFLILCILKIFADDTCLAAVGEDEEDGVLQMMESIGNLIKWTRRWMCLSVKRTGGIYI